MIPHFYRRLPGYFDFQDIYAAEVARVQDGAIFIEIGTYCARSAAFMAVEIANSGKRIEFHTIDLWNGFQRQGEWPYEKVERLFSETGALTHVNFIQSDSAFAAKRFADASVDFVFIDADHSKKGCGRDIDAWWSKVKPGGTFGGHDWFPHNPTNDPKKWPGVRDAVQEFSAAIGRTVQTRGTSWLVSPV